LRVLLLTGKGGVGKTTTAAATAVHAASFGLSTLVLSTDSAHSLADVLDAPLTAGAPHPVAPGLLAEQVDAAARLRRSWGPERSWPALRSYLARVLGALDVDPVEAGVLAGLPGAEDLAALLTLRDRVHSGGPDLVVVDCAPSAETLRLLALPEVLGRLVDRLLPLQRGSVRGLVPALGPALGRMAGVPAPDPDVAAALVRLRADLADVRSVLRAPGTSVRLVLTPEAVVLAESRRALSLLALHGYAVDAVVANRLVPSGADGWRAAWAAAQAGVLDRLRADVAPLPVLTAPYLDREPRGAAALAALGAGLLADVDADALVADPACPAPVRVEAAGDDFELVLDLGLPAGTPPELSRLDDHLVVSVPGGRRVLPLPSVLRRCAVSGARVRAGAVRVRFERDPDLWPAS
jgi:arsenite/tail-anchored protein-transporting ATPase